MFLPSSVNCSCCSLSVKCCTWCDFDCRGPTAKQTLAASVNIWPDIAVLSFSEMKSTMCRCFIVFCSTLNRLYAAVRTDIDAPVQQLMQEHVEVWFICDPALWKLYINQKSDGDKSSSHTSGLVFVFTAVWFICGSSDWRARWRSPL